MLLLLASGQSRVACWIKYAVDETEVGNTSGGGAESEWLLPGLLDVMRPSQDAMSIGLSLSSNDAPTPPYMHLQ